jgi:hypothetical protein
MANSINPNWKAAIMQASANSALTGNIKVALLAASHGYLDSKTFISELTTANIVIRSGNLAGKTFTGRTFDADDISIANVTGSQVVALLIYVDTGSDATSRMVAFFDTGVGGLPVTPNGGAINLTWDAAGIFDL